MVRENSRVVSAAPMPMAADGPEKIETVKRVFEAFGRRDIDAVLRFMHAQVRLWVVTAAVTRDGRPYVGHEGIREYAGDVERVWEELDLRPIEFDQVGDAIVVLGEVRARGPAGALREPTVWTWKFSGGLVIDCRVDSDVRAARDALGRSQTVEDLLRGYIAAFNRRDPDAMTALADPAVVTYPSPIIRANRKYVGHQGLHHWIRDVRSHDYGHTFVAREVRQLEPQRWAVLGEVTIDDVPISPFASLVSVANGLITEAREYLSEESLLRHFGHLP
jgi:ketosteroid isomerase-like protein